MYKSLIPGRAKEKLFFLSFSLVGCRHKSYGYHQSKVARRVRKYEVAVALAKALLYCSPTLILL